MIKVPSNVDNEFIAVYNVNNQGLGFRCKLRPSFPWESKNNVELICCEKK
ncbi:hypothetical protein V6M85_02370 [Sulfolobus tengchongensis]|uniref:Uncharacterized protein n=1 Tax=Sulfolobus tengchongensis TaxID=207809 RepID=A0AAX4L240_9CREN